MTDNKSKGILQVFSNLIARNLFARKMNTSFNGKRDFNAVFGYDEQVSPENMVYIYRRGGIAARIVKAYPDSVWSGPPTLYGTPEFLAAWEELNKKFNIWDILHRAEIMARLNPYSVILVGLRGTNTANPVTNGSKTLDDVLFFQPYGKILAGISRWVTDVNSPRYLKPLEYTIQPANTLDSDSTLNMGNSVVVNYTRIIHITQEVMENDLYGIPALEPIWDWLQDLRKVIGAAAENFWLTANRGMHVDIDKDLEFSATDANALADEIEEYQHQLRRFIRTRGVKIENLGNETADPKNTANLLIQLISGATGIPTRILMGSESGHLASTQDKGNWAERIEEYRRITSTPRTLGPFIKSLMNLGILPESTVWAEWPDAYKQSPLERGQTAAQTARTATNLSRTLKDTPNLLSDTEARRIIGLSTDGKALDQTADIQGETVTRQRINTANLNINSTSGSISSKTFKTMENTQWIQVI